MKKVADLPLPFYAECKRCSEAIWKSIEERDSPGRSVGATFYDSLGLGVMVSKPSLESYKIYIPEGCFARHFLLSFLFMSARNLPRLGKIVKSPRDIDDYDFHIPARLQPIFSPRAESFIADTQSLLLDHLTDFVVPQFLLEATVACTLFLAEHEMTHVTEFHFEMKSLLDAGGTRPFQYDGSVGMSKREILEGFEAHADQLAAEYVASALQGAIRGGMEKGVDPKEKMLNYAIGLLILVTMLDSKSRSLNKHGETYYPHPLVRWKIIAGTISEILPKNFSSQFIEVAQSAQEMVNHFLCDLYLYEVAREQKLHGHSLTRPVGIIGNLSEDISNFGRSVLHEHIIRAVERGRRSVFLADNLGFAVSMKPEFTATPEESEILWMHRLRKSKSRVTTAP